MNKSIKHGNVTCIGYTDLPSRMANTASTLFGNNVTKFLLSMEDQEGNFVVDVDNDEAVRSMTVVHQGRLLPSLLRWISLVSRDEIIQAVVTPELNVFYK